MSDNEHSTQDKSALYYRMVISNSAVHNIWFQAAQKMLNLQLHRSVARYILANLTKKMWLYMQIEKAPYALYLYIE